MFSCGWGSNLLSHGGFQEGTFSTFNRVGSSIPTTAAAAAVKQRRPGPYFPFSCHQREKEVARVSCELHSGGGWASRFERCRHAKRLWWLNDSLCHKPRNLCMQYLENFVLQAEIKEGKKGGFFRFITRIKPEAKGPPDNILLTSKIDTKAWEPQQFDSSQVRRDPELGGTLC